MIVWLIQKGDWSQVQGYNVQTSLFSYFDIHCIRTIEMPSATRKNNHSTNIKNITWQNRWILHQNNNKMHVDCQQLIVLKPKFFWEAVESVASVSAPQTLSRCFWSSGDQSDQTALNFFIQWPMETQQVAEKSFPATEVSFTAISKNAAWWLLQKHIW